MKKRVKGKGLNLSKETVRSLMAPAQDLDLVAVAGGSCTYVTGSGGSDGTHRVCCI
jgi:hypothetical protein